MTTPPSAAQQPAAAKKAFLLAAGLGTRLRPVSERFPKPAWPFFGVPLTAHVLHALAEAGVEEAIVNLHHLPKLLQKELTPWIPAALKVMWSFEEKILGTGGALKPWLEELGQEERPFFLINADTYRELDLGTMLRQHQETNATATLSLSALPPGTQGPITAGSAGRITRFIKSVAPGAEEATANTSANTPPQCYDFAGVHLLGPQVLHGLGAVDAEVFCINATVHSALVTQGADYRGYAIPPEAFWSDLGTPERYLAGHFELLERCNLPPLAKGRLVTKKETSAGGGTILPPSYLEEGAQVEAGAVAGPLAVVGRSATVSAGTRFARSVAWAGATTEMAGDKSIFNSILTDRGELMTPEADKGQ